MQVSATDGPLKWRHRLPIPRNLPIPNTAAHVNTTNSFQYLLPSFEYPARLHTYTPYMHTVTHTCPPRPHTCPRRHHIHTYLHTPSDTQNMYITQLCTCFEYRTALCTCFEYRPRTWALHVDFALKPTCKRTWALHVGFAWAQVRMARLTWVAYTRQLRRACIMSLLSSPAWARGKRWVMSPKTLTRPISSSFKANANGPHRLPINVISSTTTCFGFSYQCFGRQRRRRRTQGGKGRRIPSGPIPLSWPPPLRLEQKRWRASKREALRRSLGRLDERRNRRSSQRPSELRVSARATLFAPSERRDATLFCLDNSAFATRAGRSGGRDQRSGGQLRGFGPEPSKLLPHPAPIPL
jgi:hypothetical protein